MSDDPRLGRRLFISEFFCSLQGEGSRAGRPCFFVRLAGCHLSCPWCDTPYTWKPGHVTPADRVPHTLAEILARVDAAGCDLVEVTGGEPLLQPATLDLLAVLCDRGHETLLDTSGGASIAGVDPRAIIIMDLKAPSSGQTERMVWENLIHLKPGVDEVKFVVADRADYDWARRVIAEHDLARRFRVIVSPMAPLDFSGNVADWPLARDLAAWLLDDRLPVVMQMQLHRLLWPGAQRGVEEGG